MKKAVIKAGGSQHLVTEGETLNVALIKNPGKTVEYIPLMVIDGDTVTLGTPEVAKIKVSAKVVEADVKDEKVTAIRYKAKKRVKKVHGHRQHYTTIQVTSIA